MKLTGAAILVSRGMKLLRRPRQLILIVRPQGEMFMRFLGRLLDPPAWSWGTFGVFLIGMDFGMLSGSSVSNILAESGHEIRFFLVVAAQVVLGYCMYALLSKRDVPPSDSQESQGQR